MGDTVAAAAVPAEDYLIDASRFPSEGNWAFCRFDSDEIPALRLGFQRGGFNGGFVHRDPSPLYLQLHLELMTREGALLWLSSGMYRADRVICDARDMDIRLEHGRHTLLSMRGWPTVECSVRSEDGELQADLRFELNAVTVLPDCILPYCLFGMWESMGSASGSVRYRDRSIAVSGTVFFDHTRVLPVRYPSVPPATGMCTPRFTSRTAAGCSVITRSMRAGFPSRNTASASTWTVPAMAGFSRIPS